mmetsp:Transcript_20107/g.60774  ORF Transcript_20107/g.60774 Transcript_20107/m.60774 type:complete len:172 (+) Transcript_20107:279-794(+)
MAEKADDDEVELSKVKTEEDRTKAARRRAEDGGKIIELDDSDEDAAAAAPPPKKKKFPPPPCVCVELSSQHPYQHTDDCRAAVHNCVCKVTKVKRMCRAPPGKCPCTCKTLITSKMYYATAHGRIDANASYDMQQCYAIDCNADEHDCLCVLKQPKQCRAHGESCGYQGPG